MKCTIFKDNFQCRHTKYQLIVLLVRKKKVLQYKKNYPSSFNILAKSEYKQSCISRHSSVLVPVLGSRKSWAGNLKILHKKKNYQPGKWKGWNAPGLEHTGSPWAWRSVKQNIYSANTQEMFINQLSSKGGSHLIFRAVNWWNESPNSHDSVAGLFLSTQLLVPMEPEPCPRERKVAERDRELDSFEPPSGSGGKMSLLPTQGVGQNHSQQWPAILSPYVERWSYT